MVLVVVAVQYVDGHKGRVYVFLEHWHPWKAFEPRVFLQLDNPMLGSQSLRWFSLDHLSISFHTLLIKSAASTDQPAGIS